MKLLFDFAPLIGFFITYKWQGLMPATAVLIVLTLAALLVGLIRERKVQMQPLVTALIVLVFGGLTLWQQDDAFIKLKPTLINLLFAAVIIGGRLMGRQPLKALFGSAMNLTEEGWRKLSFRWAGFFLLMAGLNEWVWRTQATETWVDFKVFGLTALIFGFTMLQLPMLQRHMRPLESDADNR